MKIKTLSLNNFCVATATDQDFKIRCREDVDTESFTVEHSALLGMCDDGHCISKEMGEKQRFFCSIVFFQSKKVVATTHYVAHLEKRADETYLITDKRVGGEPYFVPENDTVLVHGFYPKNFSFLGEHESCVMTSDGLVYLGPGDFLGYKDGVLEALSPVEVLEQLAKHRTSRSPNYGSIAVSPTKTRPSRPRKGTIIHNEVSGKLEIFTNGQWRTLKFED